MDRRHDRKFSMIEAQSVCPASLDEPDDESIAAVTSKLSITASVLQLSINGAGQASSIEQESFNGRCPSECVLSILYENGSMGRSQDEASPLEHDIKGLFVMPPCRKAIGIQLRCELVVPNFALFYVQ